MRKTRKPRTNHYLKQGIIAYKGKTRQLDATIKPEEAVASLYGNNSQGYGARLQKYIIENTCLKPSPPKDNKGDGLLSVLSKKFNLLLNKLVVTIIERVFEIKVTYTDSKNNSTFAILRIKPTQKIDYYIICLVDIVIPPGEELPVDFVAYFYCLPAWYIEESDEIKRNAVNGTEEANKNNQDIEMRFTLKKEDAFEKFGKYNLLRGTSFSDLQEYLEYLNSNTPAVKSIENVKMTQPMYRKDISRRINKPRKTYQIDVDGYIIKGNSNTDTIIKFINHVHGDEAMNFFTPSFLSFDENKWRTIPVDNGNYYLNPKISFRDLKNMIERGRKYSRKNVRVIELD